jgi:hypothetical protein
LDSCHENGESAHEKSTTYEQLAIFMLRGAPEAHDACRKIAIALIDPGDPGRVSANSQLVKWPRSLRITGALGVLSAKG